MERILVSWIGGNDLNSIEGAQDEQGPLASTLFNQSFDRVELLYNYPKTQVAPYLKSLQRKIPAPINAKKVSLSSPVHFGDITESVSTLLAEFNPVEHDLNILLSPGTPAMQAIWVLLGKTQYSATFWQSSTQQGVERVEIPFNISAEYLPAADKLDGNKISALAAASVPVDAAFDNILTKNPRMQELKAQATILAQKEVPVLIYGESGTGKELFARAVHNASARADKNIVAINCGAFPSELVDSILFGHKKGAFTGALTDKPGLFEQADGGTLFLDEFGELEPSVQVRLLRFLEDGSFIPLGAIEEKKVNVRIVAATNRDLMVEVAEGRFREDLFYRIAVGVLHLPPLRDRQGDLSLLTTSLMTKIGKSDDSLKDKIISTEAKNIILAQSWPGNVRELYSTLLRAVLWSQAEEISADDIQKALFQMPEKNDGLLNKDLSQGLDLQGLCDDLMRHYIPRALAEAQGKKVRAAELLGMKNYQNLNNAMIKLGLK